MTPSALLALASILFCLAAKWFLTSRMDARRRELIVIRERCRKARREMSIAVNRSKVLTQEEKRTQIQIRRVSKEIFALEKKQKVLGLQQQEEAQARERDRQLLHRGR